MKKKFKRYDKYCVFKWDDAIKYLNDEQRKQMGVLLTRIDNGREADKKPLHKYVVVNQSMPYAEQVWKLIQEHYEKDGE